MLKERIAPPAHLPTPVTTSLSLEKVACGMLHRTEPALKRWVKLPDTRQLPLTASCPDSELVAPMLERHELPERKRAVELKLMLQRFQNPSSSCAATE
jgi:hypothetical protein